MKRVSLFRFLTMGAIAAFRQASNAFPDSNLKGDGLQTGGVFVVSRDTNKFTYAFKEEESGAGEYASMAELKAALHIDG